MASQNMSTHGGEDIHGQWPGKITGKWEETRSLENMKNPEERTEEKNRKKERKKKTLQFLPILVHTYQLEWCSTAFFLPSGMDICWYS